MDGFFVTETMVVCLKQMGTADWYRESLNIEVNTSASWSAHSLRTQPGMPSCPGHFRGFILLRALLTSAVVRDRMQSSWSSASLAVGVVLLASNQA